MDRLASSPTIIQAAFEVDVGRADGEPPLSTRTSWELLAPLITYAPQAVLDAVPDAVMRMYSTICAPFKYNGDMESMVSLFRSLLLLSMAEGGSTLRALEVAPKQLVEATRRLMLSGGGGHPMDLPLVVSTIHPIVAALLSFCALHPLRPAAHREVVELLVMGAIAEAVAGLHLSTSYLQLVACLVAHDEGGVMKCTGDEPSAAVPLRRGRESGPRGQTSQAGCNSSEPLQPVTLGGFLERFMLFWHQACAHS